MEKRFVKKRATAATEQEARDRKLALPAGTSRDRAGKCAGTDATRFMDAVGRRSVLWKVSRREALGSVLTCSEKLDGLLEELRATKPLINPVVLIMKAKLAAERMAAVLGGTKEERLMAVRAQESSFLKACGNHDGEKMLLSTMNARMEVARGASLREGGAAGFIAKDSQSAMCQVGSSPYPKACELSRCEVGRLPAGKAEWRGVGLGTGGTIAEAELVKEDRLEVWSDGRLKRLLEDTERYFPRDMRAHSVACGKAGVRALAASGGWALIKRARFVNLTKTDAGEESWARYLRLSTVSTLTCGPASLCLIMSLEKGSKADGFVVRGYNGWWRAFCRPMSDQQYLSAMSFPLDISHPGRLSGAGLTVTQARGLYGQGVDHDSVMLLLMKIGELLRAKGVVLDGAALRWFDLFSGAGIMASVAWEAAIKMDMTFSYEVCCDRSEKAVRGHKAAWVGMEPKIALSEVCDGGNEAKMAGLAPGCWCAVSGKCAPVSSASTAHGPGTAAKQEELENFLEEWDTGVRLAMKARPDVLVCETAANLINHQATWERFQRVLVATSLEHDWTYQVICPKRLLANPTPRCRIFVVAIAKVPVSLVPTEDLIEAGEVEVWEAGDGIQIRAAVGIAVLESATPLARRAVEATDAVEVGGERGGRRGVGANAGGTRGNAGGAASLGHVEGGSAGRPPSRAAHVPKRARAEAGVAERPADLVRSLCWAAGGPTALRKLTDADSSPGGGGPPEAEGSLSVRLLVGVPADAAADGAIVVAPVGPGHELRAMRCSTTSRWLLSQGTAKIGVFTKHGREWRTAPITLVSGEPGTVVERRAGGRWSQFCLIAPSLHLREQGIFGGGYFNLLPETSDRKYLTSFVGEQLSSHVTAAEAVADAKQWAEGLAESCIMVLLRDGRWIVLDAAEAGPPYLQLINDPSPHLGANAVVSDSGEVYLDDTVDSYSLGVQHSLQTGAEVLWLYGKHYDLGGQA